MRTPPPPQRTLELARQREAETGKPHYLVRPRIPGGSPVIYTITDRIPLCCADWFTTDGVQHG